MKIIKYQLMREVNYGTEDEPHTVQTFHACEIRCSDTTFEPNYVIALKEAYNGEVTVEEVADPETPGTPGSDPSVWDDMAAAIAEGVNDV